MYIYATLCIGACTAADSRVAPIAARIPSSNAWERGPRANAECGNCLGPLLVNNEKNYLKSGEMIENIDAFVCVVYQKN